MKKITKKLKVIKKHNHQELQTAWSVKPSVGDHPFQIVDLLNSLVMNIDDQLADIEDDRLLESMNRVFDKNDEVGRKKVAEHYRKIFFTW